MKSPRTYTVAEKQAAITRTLEVGPATASKELGISSGTLGYWAHAGAGASVHTDLLDLRDRALELFKVVSRDGKPEVWLLGQPLLGLIAK